MQSHWVSSCSWVQDYPSSWGFGVGEGGCLLWTGHSEDSEDNGIGRYLDIYRLLANTDTLASADLSASANILLSWDLQTT